MTRVNRAPREKGRCRLVCARDRDLRFQQRMGDEEQDERGQDDDDRQRENERRTGSDAAAARAIAALAQLQALHCK